MVFLKLKTYKTFGIIQPGKLIYAFKSLIKKRLVGPQN